MLYERAQHIRLVHDHILLRVEALSYQLLYQLLTHEAVSTNPSKGSNQYVLMQVLTGDCQNLAHAQLRSGLWCKQFEESNISQKHKDSRSAACGKDLWEHSLDLIDILEVVVVVSEIVEVLPKRDL